MPFDLGFITIGLSVVFAIQIIRNKRVKMYSILLYLISLVLLFLFIFNPTAKNMAMLLIPISSIGISKGYRLLKKNEPRN